MGVGNSALTGRLSGLSDYNGERVGQDLLEIQFYNSGVGEGLVMTQRVTLKQS